MLLSNLVTTAALLRAKEEKLFEDVSDSDLIDIKYTQAVLELGYDLSALWNTPLDSALMQAYLTTNESYFQEVLALKQIYLYLFETDATEGSMNGLKLKNYKSAYDMRIRQAKDFISDYNIPSATTVQIYR